MKEKRRDGFSPEAFVKTFKVSGEDFEKYCSKCCFLIDNLSALERAGMFKEERISKPVLIKCGPASFAELKYLRSCGVKPLDEGTSETRHKK